MIVHKLLILAGVIVMTPAQALSVKDDAGHTLDLPHPATRIISLAPSLTEMLYAAGGGDKMVGAVEYSDFPPAALKVQRIGSNQKLDLERIATLKPDLVLVWYHGNALREVERLGALGIPMFYLEPHTIGDIPGALERIGQLVGSEKVAQDAAQGFRARHAALRAQYSGRPSIKVFYQITAQPLLTINDKQIISDVIRLCGGVNVFGNEPMLVPQLSTESVVSRDPDVIMAAHVGSGQDRARRDPEAANVKSWSVFTSMKAVRTGQIWLVPGDEISRHGPRILDAAQAVCTALDSARAATGAVK
ncbi:MAG: Cobalamin-binding protein [Rhodocyclales bacterium]|nr:Cobalamin-binding protein [Rhodocyclales bacterium]